MVNHIMLSACIVHDIYIYRYVFNLLASFFVARLHEGVNLINVYVLLFDFELLNILESHNVIIFIYFTLR